MATTTAMDRRSTATDRANTMKAIVQDKYGSPDHFGIGGDRASSQGGGQLKHLT
jgi:hypothetical protein